MVEGIVAVVAIAGLAFGIWALTHSKSVKTDLTLLKTQVNKAEADAASIASVAAKKADQAGAAL